MIGITRCEYCGDNVKSAYEKAKESHCDLFEDCVKSAYEKAKESDCDLFEDCVKTLHYWALANGRIACIDCYLELKHGVVLPLERRTSRWRSYASGPYDREAAGPWQENAIRQMEDG